MIFLISFIVFAFILSAMAVGVMAGRAPIKGSCGGIGALGIDQSCDLCGGDPQRCETETRVPFEATSSNVVAAKKADEGAVVFDPAER
jgi:hypothetical protein